MRIFPLQIINMQCACQCVLSEIGQTEQCRERYPSHATAQGSFLCIKAVGPNTLMSHQMQSFILYIVIGFLENSDIIHTTFMQIPIFIRIHRINFHADHAEIFSCQLTSLTNVFDITHGTAFACQNQDFLHAAVRDDLHFLFNLLHIQLHAVDVVIAVEAAVYTVILAVIRNIQGGEKINGIAEMLAGFDSCLLRHFL